MTYKQMVAEAKRLGRELSKEAEPRQWRLAELCFQACDEQGVKPGRWAADIGRSIDSVRVYREVWAKKAERARLSSFLDAYVLANSSAEGAAAIEEVAARTGNSLDYVRTRHKDEVREIRERLKADPDVTAEVLADPALVKKALENPLVADAVVADRQSRDHLTEARMGQRRSEAEAARVTAGNSPHSSRTPRQPHELDTIGEFDRHALRAERELRAMLQVLIDKETPLDDLWRETLLADTDRIERLLDGVRSWLNSGGVTDRALAELLREEAS